MEDLLEIKEILLGIKEELKRANDLKEVELGIEFSFDYKVKRDIRRNNELEEKRKKKCKK